MIQTGNQEIDPPQAAQARLLRLARYRAMQLQLEQQRRQQTARGRLLALRPHPWGWLAL